MPNYDPLTWLDEVPGVTPLRFRLRDGSNNILLDNVSIELVTSVTPGTPLNAANLNHIEQGIAKARCEVLQVRKTATDTDPVENGWKKLVWGAEDFDDWNGHSNSVNPSRITIAEAGVYLLMGDLRYSGTPELQFRQSGSVVWDGEAWILSGTVLIPPVTLGAGGGATVGRQFYLMPIALSAGAWFEVWLADGVTFYTNSVLSLIRLR